MLAFQSWYAIANGAVNADGVLFFSSAVTDDALGRSVMEDDDDRI